MPEGAVFVGRPTKWGNPFIVEDFLMFGAVVDAYAGWCLDFQDHEEARHAAVDLYRDIVSGFWNPTKVDQLGDQAYQCLYEDLRKWRKRIGGHPLEIARSELRGKDLCCWCSPAQTCHADVLLEIANREEL
jgi:hypothetical protein